MTRLLVGYDASEPSEAALSYAMARAAHGKDEVLAVTVVPDSLKDSFFSRMLLPGIDLDSVVGAGNFLENARKRLEQAVEPYRQQGANVSTDVLTGDAAEVILSTARDRRVDEVVVGYKSYEKIEQHSLGTVAEKLVRYAPCNVTVVRGRPRPLDRP